MLPVYGVTQWGYREEEKDGSASVYGKHVTLWCVVRVCGGVIYGYTVLLRPQPAAVSAPPCWFAHANEGALNHQVLKVKFLSYHIHEWGPHSQTYMHCIYNI